MGLFSDLGMRFDWTKSSGKTSNDSHVNERGRDSSLDRSLHHLPEATVGPFFAPSIGAAAAFSIPTDATGSQSIHNHILRRRCSPETIHLLGRVPQVRPSLSLPLSLSLPMLTWASPPPMHAVTKQRSEELVKQAVQIQLRFQKEGTKLQNVANSSQ